MPRFSNKQLRFGLRRGVARALLLTLVTTLALAQSASQLLTPGVKRVGARLACLCGACNNTVAECPMLECHYAKPAKEKIYKMLADGYSDDEIVDSFVKDKGLVALSVPPTEGFHLLSWVMPFVAIAMGLLVVWWFIKRYTGSRIHVPAADDQEVFDRYKDRIEKDLSELDK